MNTQKSKSIIIPPKSSSSYQINLLGIIIFFVVLWVLNKLCPGMHTITLTAICLLTTSITLFSYAFFITKAHKRSSAGLLDTPRDGDKTRFIIKLIGLYGTSFFILLIYYLIQINFHTEFTQTFFNLLKLLAPGLIILSFVYFWEIDRRQKDPYDEYWHIGCLFTGQFKKVNFKIIKKHVCLWFLKGFFTPFLFAILINYIQYFLSLTWENISFYSVYIFSLNLVYLIDIAFGVISYIATFRLFDTHVRSTDPTFLGWLVCLICYGPFNTYFGISLLNYDDGFSWNHWFMFIPWCYYFYGVAIIFLSTVYALSSVALGSRVSNLTYRGVITSGPYRYTKHPAFLCKVTSWWLISMPFLNIESPAIALKHTLALCVISFIYFMRAKTEENHLSNYPEYVEYANWINKHGVFSSITKHFPSLQYSPKKAQRWKSII